MDLSFKDLFIERWKKYFGNSSLPITFYYSKNDNGVEHVVPAKGRSCLICELAKVRSGHSQCFNSESLKCMGAKRYCGYRTEMSKTFRYFLSFGIEDQVEGERYKISPEVVDETQKLMKPLEIDDQYLIFKRWDKLAEIDEPEVVVFFARPEVISGLFTLANFDQVDPNGGVIAPFGAGCGSIVHYPYHEIEKENPKCILGMFDPSAQPCMPLNTLTFSIPMNRFIQLAGYMDQSFLITETWEEIKKRI